MPQDAYTIATPSCRAGGYYSSDGFVLAGFVLCAVTGAPTWQALNQTALLAHRTPGVPSADSVQFNDVVFMPAGV